MLINTKHFGEVEIDEANILEFPEGIFGFQDEKRYVILYDNLEGGGPFSWLQSLDVRHTALPLINPMNYFPQYNPEISFKDIEKIGELKEEDLILFSVVVVPENIEKMTTNLKAPIVVNVKTRKGIQVIVQDEDYEIKHNLYNQMKQLQEAGE